MAGNMDTRGQADVGERQEDGVACNVGLESWTVVVHRVSWPRADQRGERGAGAFRSAACSQMVQKADNSSKYRWRREVGGEREKRRRKQGSESMTGESREAGAKGAVLKLFFHKFDAFLQNKKLKEGNRVAVPTAAQTGLQSIPQQNAAFSTVLFR